MFTYNNKILSIYDESCEIVTLCTFALDRGMICLGNYINFENYFNFEW